MWYYSPSISVNPIEYPLLWSSKNRHREQPEPMYKDDNVTVYGVPIYAAPTPRLTSSQTSTSESRGMMTGKKREPSRSPSPSSPAKRRRRDDGTGNATSTSTLPDDRPLLQRMLSPGFSPTLLRGEEAQEWRILLIRYMFPRKRAPEPPASEKKPLKQHAKQKQKAQKGAVVREDDNKPSAVLSVSESTEGDEVSQLEDVALDEHDGAASTSASARDPKAELMRGLRHFPLPPLEHDSGSPPATNLCYILVGPRVRGKFDAQKAAALGVHGPSRGQLAKGNVVQVKLDDPDRKGEKIVKTIRPEECVGPSEAPQVRICISSLCHLHCI